MTKSELVGIVAKMSKTTNSSAEHILDAFRDVVQSTVKKGGEVSYPGFGKFSRVNRKARTGRNPQTGAAIKVPASKAPKFSASSRFKGIVRGEVPGPRVP